MICFPNAKINLGLHVTHKRTDGYHDIETVFYPVPLRDALEIVPAKRESFRLSGICLPSTSEDNLVIKAYNLLKNKYFMPAYAICLRKVIPFGAGLGGGSSDAAYMLKLLNSCAELNLSVPELETLAAKLGADCPFFIRNTPVVATGTGNCFEPIALSLKGYWIYIVKPEVSVSTKEAYSSVTPSPPPVPLKEVVAKPVSQWREFLTNDFETSVFRRYPEIGRIKEKLYAKGAVYASMSGSGSSVYGLFEKEPGFCRSNHFVWKGRLE
ncbi:MAG: 4-(cytidine 5'-diphospho)-2-C-methyl-D-erythritol kinase [Tannerella sp.]|jgi:4-diphosphocytidyl-2-C-methyl-D-erythritol kinase|nr:4-(cytidine 5'-diphospho)-2-C-methyl-D-erythritol kinase [Tannerella sp.]